MDPWAILNQTTQKSFNTVDDYQNAAEKKNRIDAGDQANQENAMKLQEMQKQQQASQIMNDVLKSHSNPTSDGVTPTVHPPAGQQVPQTATAQNGQAFPTGAPVIPPSTQQAPNNGTFGPSTLDSTIANMKQISSAVMNPQPQPTQNPQAPPSQAATPQSPQVPIPTQLTHEPLPSQKDDQNAQFITPAGTPSYAARQAMAQRLTQAGLGDQIPTIVNHWQAQDLQARKVEMEKHTQDITFVDSLLQGVKMQPNEQMKSVAWSQTVAAVTNRPVWLCL